MVTNRSYVRRQGRMMPAQRQALDELWTSYGIREAGVLNPGLLFGRQAPLYLEIGFGMGDALLEMAGAHPENDYLGVEVHLPGVGQLLLRIREKGITNIRIDRRDAIEVLELLPAGSLSGAFLLFPDPWSKKRHHKRRLVQPPFVNKLGRLLKPGGFFHAATDWADYAQHILEVMEASDGFVNLADSGSFHPRPPDRPMTRFEQRGLNRGHVVKNLLYKRANSIL
nr:tRNA (guanosine(46)-N7)-methyltransferase TrmB [Desulfobulbaceae bacterium]